MACEARSLVDWTWTFVLEDMGNDETRLLFTLGIRSSTSPAGVDRVRGRPPFRSYANRAGVPRIRLHDVRHTHGTLLIKAGVPVKVVSERLGHGNPAFTIDTYQHVLPGMQAEAARTFEQLINVRQF